MELIDELINNIWVGRIFWSIVVIIVAIIIYAIITRLLSRGSKRSSRLISEKKNKTYIRMLKSIIGSIIFILALLTILEIFGVDVTSFIAGLGIASVVAGLALQDVMKDIFRGFNIISENYYHIGDVVKIGDDYGQVTSISLRTTKLKSIRTNDIISISNRNIDVAEVSSGAILLQVPLPYDLDTKKTEAIINEIVKNIQKAPEVETATYQGVNELGESAINHQIIVFGPPARQFQVRRNALSVITATLEAKNISVPFPQLDIHQA